MTDNYPGSVRFHARITADAAAGDWHAQAVRQYIDILLARIEQLERDLEAAYARPAKPPVVIGGEPGPLELPVLAAPDYVCGN